MQTVSQCVRASVWVLGLKHLPLFRPGMMANKRCTRMTTRSSRERERELQVKIRMKSGAIAGCERILHSVCVCECTCNELCALWAEIFAVRLVFVFSVYTGTLIWIKYLRVQRDLPLQQHCDWLCTHTVGRSRAWLEWHAGFQQTMTHGGEIGV